MPEIKLRTKPVKSKYFVKKKKGLWDKKNVSGLHKTTSFSYGETFHPEIMSFIKMFDEHLEDMMLSMVDEDL